VIKGKANFIIDQAWGSSGKGKISTYLVDKYGITNVSSANLPNAGHSAIFDDGTKFVAKAIPTALILKKVKGIGLNGFISPGSGFSPKQLVKEWYECGKPNIFIHSRALYVTDEHAARERQGSESTKHIASTMQGSATALVDKILRKSDASVVSSIPLETVLQGLLQDVDCQKYLAGGIEEALAKIQVVDAFEFRNLTHNTLDNGHTWLHEGSQGYALSIDHGSHYPFCTSRNCSVQASMDYMAIPPSMVGDIYMNLRTWPIRVGNVVENGEQKGYSGGFYEDCHEVTWEQVAAAAGMPKEEAEKLAERERTTVTKRIRRVCTFSWIGLKDAVRVNGVTKISVNFVQYLNWKDNGIRGGKEALEKLSKETRTFIDKVEEVAGVPVVMIGTGALHNEIIDLDV
jgi:adenylosuccinate synthase